MALCRWKRPGRGRAVAVLTLASFLASMSPARFARADVSPAETPPEASGSGTAAPPPRTTGATTRESTASGAVQAELVGEAPKGPSNARTDTKTADVSGAPAALEAPAAPAQVQSLTVGGDKTGVSSQAISLPQGSGTIQGMGESF